MRTPYGAWRASYTRGRWLVLSGPTSMVIMQPAPPTATRLVSGVWNQLLAGASITEISSGLSGFGLDTMPDLAVLFWDDEQLHCLLRGRLQVLDAESGELLASGTGARTWYERSLPSGRVYLPLDDVQPEEMLQLPLVVGAVEASTVFLDTTEGPVSSAMLAEVLPQERALEPGLDVPEPDVVAEPVDVFLAAPAAVAGMAIPGVATGAPVDDEELSSGPAEPLTWQVPVAEEAEPSAFDAELDLWDEHPEPAAKPEPAAEESAPVAEAWAADEEPEPVEEQELAAGAPEPGFAQTRLQPSAAPFEPPVAPVGQFGWEPTQALGERPPWAPGQDPAAQHVLADRRFGQGSTGTTGPWGAQGFSAAQVPDLPVAPPGRTSVFEELPVPGADQTGAAAQHQEIASTGSSAPPKAAAQPDTEDSVILGALCPLGHANPLGAASCRICNDTVDSRNPKWVNRPVLAILGTPAGDRLPLLGPILVGRAPSAADDPDAELLRVPSPHHDISRTHARIAPHGWQIEVSDLHSTNGTVVTKPDGQRIRLEPGQTIELELGGTIDLGDGQIITLMAP